MRKEKRLRHLAATTDTEKRSSQSQKGFDEQQTAATCNLSLRESKIYDEAEQEANVQGEKRP